MVRRASRVRQRDAHARGRAALADALERDDWTDQNERPAFLTWLAVSWQCRPGVFRKQVRKRRKFLECELARKQQILLAVRREVGHANHEAVWMLSVSIGKRRTVLRWLKKVVREAPRRAAAQKPDYLADRP